VSCCATLQICTQRRDETEARKALESAINLFLTICFEYGILDKALKERGFTSVGPAGAKADIATDMIKVEHQNFDQTFDVEVPMFLVAQQQGALSACRPQ